MASDTVEVPVLLVSNSSLDIFPNNTVASFKNQLFKPLELSNSESWEVAMKEVSYTKSWFQFTSPQEIIIARRYVRQIADKRWQNQNISSYTTLRPLQPRSYQNVEEVVTDVNDILRSHGQSTYLKLIPGRNSVQVESIVLKDDNLRRNYFEMPIFSDELTMFLGLNLVYETLLNKELSDNKIVISNATNEFFDNTLNVIAHRRDVTKLAPSQRGKYRYDPLTSIGKQSETVSQSINNR